MEISTLTFIVTDDCNFNCSYCFQKKEKNYINNDTVKTAVDFFHPFFIDNTTVNIGFYGGEPLLGYPQIEYTVLRLLEKNKIRDKKPAFTITTNGSLLTDEMLDFFNAHRFHLILSFDGLAQDVGRKKNTLEQMVEIIARIRTRPGIKLEINSIFSPATVAALSGSLRFMIEQNGPEINFDFSSMEAWSKPDLDILNRQLEQLSDYLVLFYKATGKIPVKNYRLNVNAAGVFQCSAGKNQLAVTPDGHIWGCFLFHDYFKNRRDSPMYRDYSFGNLADFTRNYKTRLPEISANYDELRQDLFQVGKNFCFLCKDVGDCAVCPINAAYSSGSIGKISCNRCNLEKIRLNSRKNFLEKIRAQS